MPDQKLGIIAGSGQFPLRVAEEAKRKGLYVAVLGIKGVTDAAIDKIADAVHYFPLGQIDKPIALFKKAGIARCVMAGKVQHSSLFGGVLPDLRAMKLLARLKDKRTDTILAAVAEEFAKDGIELMPSAAYLEHLVARAGVLTARKPSAAEQADSDLGWRAAKAVAGFDIGQTVVVREGAVIAVEAMEGTDACIRRAAEIARAHGTRPALVVVKVAKPKQDLRYDLPVLGLGTLDTLKDCLVTALALEADKTLIFDKDEFIRRADAMKLAIVAATPKETTA